MNTANEQSSPSQWRVVAGIIAISLVMGLIAGYGAAITLDLIRSFR